MTELALVELDPRALHANPWNPNAMTERQLAAERESIELHGFVDPVTVRPHGRGYEIIDGEHRVRVARELGLERVPAVVLEIDDDTTARRLTLALGNHGNPEDRALRELLNDLQPILGDDLALGLPFTEGELAGLLADAPADPEPDDDGEWITVTARLPSEMRPVLQEAETRARQAGWEPNESRPVALGQLWEILAAAYIASAQAADQAEAAPPAGAG